MNLAPPPRSLRSLGVTVPPPYSSAGGAMPLNMSTT